ncbi:uncharacterized protein [Epargyreus clarus]|uniref:uncharacterized protein isoform X2 n=1 Tax=Epargyreus clarus TaxID=520877 RepID=UPI003C2DDDA1
MAAQKQPKAELIAIYRLEFYKKQQNWKLAKDARKTPDTDSVPATPVKNTILNETYNIDTDEDNVHNTLNDAFINDDSDKNAPTLHVSHSGLQTQSLEPIHACQVCQQRDSQPASPWADYVDDRDPGDWVEGLKCGGDNEFEGYDGRWIDGMVWTNSGLPQAWAGEMPAEVNFLQGANCPENVIWSADNILCSQLTPWPDDQLWMPEIWGDDKLLRQSLESVEDFLIGAHSAPHSSEIELCLTSG